MARNIAAAALGVIVMFFFIVATFAIASNVLTDEQAYQPGTFDPSPLRAGITLLLTLLGAIVGGFTAASIARSVDALRGLAVFVVAVGVLAAMPSMRYDRTQMPPRTGEPSDRQVAMQVPPPMWIALLNPFLGAGGVVIGAGLRGRSVL